jgi:hypothetical protein
MDTVIPQETAAAIFRVELKHAGNQIKVTAKNNKN